MGSAFSPSVANLFMATLEDNFIFNAAKNPFSENIIFFFVLLMTFFVCLLIPHLWILLYYGLTRYIPELGLSLQVAVLLLISWTPLYTERTVILWL